MARFRAVLIGDSRLFLDGLSFTLESESCTVAGIIPSADLLPWLKSIGERPELIIWDCPTELEQNLPIWAEIHREFPEIGIIVITEQNNTMSLNRALGAGVRGLLPRCISIGALRLSLQLISLGENISTVPVTLSDDGQAGSSFLRGLEARKLRVPLSSREAQILERLGVGSPNKVIARELGIAEATIKVHVKAVLRKINVSNRTQAAIWARDNGV